MYNYTALTVSIQIPEAYVFLFSNNILIFFIGMHEL